VVQLELDVEMVLDDRLVAAGHEDEVLDARLARLVDDILDHRTVDDGQHLLRHRLRRRQKPGTQPCHRKYCLADSFRSLFHPQIPLFLKARYLLRYDIFMPEFTATDRNRHVFVSGG
jgi:hypothetical protein